MRTFLRPLILILFSLALLPLFTGEVDADETEGFVAVMDEEFKSISQGDALVSQSSKYIVVFSDYDRIEINYFKDNETLYHRNFTGTIKKLYYHRDATIIIKYQGDIVFEAVLHPDTFGNVLKYKFGVNAPTTGLARFNTFLGSVVGSGISLCLCYFVVVPILDDRVKKEI